MRVIKILTKSIVNTDMGRLEFTVVKEQFG